jgi:hypothetical protein
MAQQTIEQIQKRFTDDGRGYALRDWSSFTKVRDKHHLVCPNHPENDWFASIHPILSKRKLGCPICNIENASARLRADSDEVAARLEDKGFTLVGNYKNMQESTECMCHTCKSVKPVKISNILHADQGCYNCGINKPYTPSEVEHGLNLVGLILLDKFSGRCADKHSLLCKHCGAIKNISDPAHLGIS